MGRSRVNRKKDERDPEGQLDKVSLFVQLPRYLREYVNELCKRTSAPQAVLIRNLIRWMWERDNFRATVMSAEDIVKTYNLKGFVIDPLLTKDQRDRLLDELRLLHRKVEDEQAGKPWGEVHVKKD